MAFAIKKITTQCLSSFLLCSLFLMTTVTAGPKEIDPNETVTQIPKLSYKLLNGKKLTPKQYEGKGLLITFWATWCPPCVAEIPHLNDLYKKYKDQGIIILGLSIDNKKSTVQRFMKKTKIHYPVAMSTKKAMQGLGPINAVPTTIVVNEKGDILYKTMGYESKEKLEEIIAEILPKEKEGV